MIPVGETYTAKYERTFPIHYACAKCSYETVAQVQSFGEGRASAMLFIGREAQQERAAESARQEAEAAANYIIHFVPCPSCGVVNVDNVPKQMRSGRIGTWLLCAGLIVAGVFFSSASRDASLGVICIGAGILGFIIDAFRRDPWSTRKAAERVRFMSQEELAYMLEQARKLEEAEETVRAARATRAPLLHVPSDAEAVSALDQVEDRDAPKRAKRRRARF